MWQEFKKFAMRGNMLDLAVGLILGSAFGAIVTSLVKDVIMPPIGLLLGGVDFTNLYVLLREGDPAGPYAALADAQAAGAVSINYGAFINTIVSFIIIALAVFLLVRGVNKLLPQPAPAAAPATRECPYCLSAVPLKATRCPHCTSELPPA
jgi:large conductance mechanosensitive channel